ncbi:hypothetical protein V8E36_008284 [Tilletia maclaganii]
MTGPPLPTAKCCALCLHSTLLSRPPLTQLYHGNRPPQALARLALPHFTLTATAIGPVAEPWAKDAANARALTALNPDKIEVAIETSDQEPAAVCFSCIHPPPASPRALATGLPPPSPSTRSQAFTCPASDGTPNPAALMQNGVSGGVMGKEGATDAAAATAMTTSSACALPETLPHGIVPSRILYRTLLGITLRSRAATDLFVHNPFPSDSTEPQSSKQLTLSGEAVGFISHAIREQLLVHRRAALELLRADELESRGARPLEDVWRDLGQVRESGPLLEPLAEDELEEIETDAMRIAGA